MAAETNRPGSGFPQPAGSSAVLFERYPQLRSRVAHVGLGTRQTPVQRMAALSRHLGSEVWIKRDDLTADLYGGNKVRKLEFVLARARELGAREVFTVGGTGSHQVLATALYGRELGLRTAAVVFPQPLTPHVQHVLRAVLEADCRLEPAAHMFTVPSAGARLVARRLARGRRAPALVPPGASNVRGALGYVSAALELAEQIRTDRCPRPQAIVTAFGSAGTAAGLMVGLRLAGLEIPVYAVRVVMRALGTARMLAGLCSDTAGFLRARGVPVPGEFRAADMRVVGDFVGAGYGHVTDAGQAAVALAAEDGIRLETTYTGKALAGLIDHVKRRGPGWRHVLFWNTFNSRPVLLHESLAWARAHAPRALRSILREALQLTPRPQKASPP